jgi:hypothetical protein
LIPFDKEFLYFGSAFLVTAPPSFAVIKAKIMGAQLLSQLLKSYSDFLNHHYFIKMPLSLALDQDYIVLSQQLRLFSQTVSRSTLYFSHTKKRESSFKLSAKGIDKKH